MAGIFIGFFCSEKYTFSRWQQRPFPLFRWEKERNPTDEHTEKSQLLPALVLGMVSALLASLLNILLPIPTSDANTAYVIAMIKAAAAFVLA